MKKRGGFGGPPPMSGGAGGGGMNPANLQKMMKKMQDDMAAAQVALESETVEVTAVGGAVTIVITGHQRVQSIIVKPEAVDTTDPEWMTDLQDLLVIAVNKAIEESQAMAASRMEAIGGGLGDIPGLGGLLG